jgi:hypothetical protein
VHETFGTEGTGKAWQKFPIAEYVLVLWIDDIRRIGRRKVKGNGSTIPEAHQHLTNEIYTGCDGRQKLGVLPEMWMNSRSSGESWAKCHRLV